MMSLRLRRALAAALLVFGMIVQGTVVFAGTTGTLSGTIVDEKTHRPVTGAKVSVSSGSQTESTTTDARGHFVFVTLAPDTYTLAVEKDGFEPYSEQGLTIQADQTRTVSYDLAESLHVIARVQSRPASSLVKPGTTSDVYSISPSQAAAASPLGGGTNLNSAYSAIASVPGTYIPAGSGAIGWGQSVNIRGGDYTQTGFELDGVPINRAFDQYSSSPLSSLGNQEVQVYTGAAPVDAQANGLAGYINQVIQRGGSTGHPFGIDLGVGGPAFYHKFNFQTSGATTNRLFDYYFGTGGYTQDVRLIDQFNGTSYFQTYGGSQYNFAAIGCGTQNPSVGCYNNGATANLLGGVPLGPNGYAFAPILWGFDSTVSDRETLANVHFGIPHHRDGGRDEVQLLYNVGQTYNAPNASSNSWGSLLPNIQNGTIPLANGTTLPNAANGCPSATDAACAAGVSPFFLDQNAYTGPLNAPLTTANLGSIRNLYFAGSGAVNRPFNATVPLNQTDSETTGFAITKLQYQKNFGTKAYARVYGYTLYSDRIDNGITGLFQNYVGAFSPDYVISSHTRGIALNVGDQINDRNLLQFDTAYTTSDTTRNRNDTASGAGTAPVAYLVSATNPTAGCFSAPAAVGAAVSAPCAAADGYKLPGVGGASLITRTKGQLSNVGNVGGLTCGAGPCEFLAVNTGEIGAINSVQPQFENVGLQDTFHASNRLDLNFGLRYENFGYNMRSSNTLGNQLLVNDYNASHCIAGTAITKAPCAPGSTPTALNARSTDLAYQVWSPRFGATYKLNPENVFRFSYGRFSQPAETSAVQATNFQAGVPSTGFYSNFGFAGFSRNVVPEISYNTDFSWEHQFKGSDTSFSITPFLRKTQNEFIAILVDPKTNFVANVNGLNRNVSGFEFALRKGDFNRNGFSGLVSYTYTHATAKYKVFPTGGSFVAQANQLIQQYNGYTSFCAKSPTNSLCGPTVSGAAAAPCYTAAGTADPACAAGSIVNPYWNSKPGSMFDPNASYVPFNQNIGPGASGVATSYVVPDVLAVVLNYKRNRWSFTPSFQVQAGAKYGSPLVAQGVAPDSCAALTTAIAANDPRYIYGLPTGSAAASGYDAASCATAISIPNPVTKQFDGIGAFTQPSVLITNLAIGYEISPKATIRLTAANILDRCFGGTPAAWNIPTYGCSYGQQGTYVGNFYNPGDKIQLGVAQPYSPIVAGALQSTNASNTPPFAMFLDFSLSL